MKLPLRPVRAASVTTAANVKSAELQGTIIVGEETAARLTKVLGRKVNAGESFDLGTIAYTNKNVFRRLWGLLCKRPAAAAKLFR